METWEQGPIAQYWLSKGTGKLSSLGSCLRVLLTSSSLWFPPEQFYTHQVTAPHSTRRSTDFNRIHQGIGLDSTERWVKESWLCAKYCIHIQKRTTYKSWSACTTLSSWVSQGKSAGGFLLPTTLKQLCPPRQGKEHEFAKKEGRVGKHRGTKL